jgi:RHS repeat-associated protein
MACLLVRFRHFSTPHFRTRRESSRIHARCLAQGLCGFLLLLCVGIGNSQVGQAPGVQMFSTRNFNIDLASSSITVGFPIRSKAGKIPVSYALVANYQIQVAQNVTELAYNLLVPGGVAPQLNAHTFGYGVGWTTTSTLSCLGAYIEVYGGWMVYDTTGAGHPLGNFWVDAEGTCYEFPTLATTSDGSGLTVTSTVKGYIGTRTIYDSAGYSYSTSGTLTDPDQATVTISGGGSTHSIIDSLGSTFLTQNFSGNLLSSLVYPNANGSNDPPFTIAYQSFNLQSNFNCSGLGYTYTDYSYSAISLPISITDPTGAVTKIGYEATPGHSGYITGRLASITYGSGGSISYAYSQNGDAQGQNGFDCVSFVVPLISVTVNDNNGNVNKWTYANAKRTTANNFTVTVTDPASNQTAYNFAGEFQTQAAAYQGGCPTTISGCTGGGTVLSTVTTCYNANFTNCATASSVALPMSQTDVYTSYNGSHSRNLVETKFDAYGNVAEVKQYDFGAATPPTGTPASDTLNYYGQSWNGTSCTAYPSGVYIYNTPCYSYTNLAGTTVAKTQITYSNSGHPTSTVSWTGSTSLTSTATYNNTGTVATVTDVNQNGVYTYAYNGTDGCNGLLPTSVTVTAPGLPSGGLSTSTQWNCNGAVATQTADANQQPTTYAYNDPLWRITSMTDPLNNVTNYSYTPTTFETVMNFGTVSTSDTLITTDGLGRQIFSQTRQAQGSTTFDTVQTTYGWTKTTTTTAGGPFTTTSIPYSGTQAQSAPAGTGVTTTQGDAVSRPISVGNTGGGMVSNTYTSNDVLSVLGPAPAGENTKQTQTQFDGLGRVTSVCGIESSGGSACNQATGSLSGVVTTTAYTSASGSQTVASSRGSQSRSITVDGLGRTTQKVTPEGGTWNYTYDTACSSSYTNTSGRLAKLVDPNNNTICYSYDALGRLLEVNATNGTVSSCRWFYYDNSTGYLGALPTGVSLSNQYGRMVEAATDSCQSTKSSTTLLTDEWFSYDKDGRAATQWESTPHSGTYYEAIASFTGPVLTSVQLANPSLYTMTYGLEGEGRWTTLKDTTANQDIVTGTTFFPAANPGVIKLTGTTPDNDAYTYDTNTGNVKQFVFTVGDTPASLTGVLGWNPNGSLGQLTVTDGFNAGGIETCYSNSSGSVGAGYDDLERLIEFDCGSGNWGQEFTYDEYDNLSKSVISGRTGTTWSPGYSATTNHCNSCTYDSNGDVTGDGNDVYGWNQFSKLAWTAPSGTPDCGSSGRCATYDAFGRMVETSNSSTWREYWYTQAGKMVMAGTTLSYGRWPTSFGTVETVGTTNFDYLHQDWLGNSRIVSNIGNNTVVADQAYTPYGEIYNIFGANNAEYQVFAGTIADLAASTATPIMWDTPNRELSYVGRWLSPDPAGSGWNQYAYVTNPNGNVDPSGLCPPGTTSGGYANNCGPAWFGYGANCPQPGPGGCNVNGYGGGNCMISDNSQDAGGTVVPCGLAFGSASSTLSGSFYMGAGTIAGSSGSSGQVTVVQSSINGVPIGSTTTYYGDPSVVSLMFGGSFNGNAANNGTNNSILTPQQQKALHCVGQAAAAKGVSIVLDVAGSIPGFGNLFSGTVEGIQGLNAGYYGLVTLSSAGNALLNPSASGAAFTGTSAALTVGSLVFQGSKVIPFVGTLVSLGSLAYDATKAVQAYQQCMAGPR